MGSRGLLITTESRASRAASCIAILWKSRSCGADISSQEDWAIVRLMKSAHSGALGRSGHTGLSSG
eukprot:7060910-Pyramimonas_sp.AAC.1